MQRTGVDSSFLENIKLANKLHKPLIKKIKNRKINAFSLDNIWVADTADTQLLSKLMKTFTFRCVLLIFTTKMFELLKR